jgi:hypothetical protein
VNTETADLEVVVLGGDEPPATLADEGHRRRPRRRWPFPVAAAVLAGLLVLPVKANLATRQFRQLVPGAVAWGPDSRRVFFVRGQQVTQLWSYQPGRGRPETVRIRGIETDDVSTLAPPAA